MGLAKLSRVTVIAPRTEYEEVTRNLAQFEEFHPLEGREPNFDPAVEELTVRAVRLFAQADQAVKDLSIALMPGTLDIVFRGVKIPRSDFDVETWEDLLNKAETQLTPIVDEIRTEKTRLQKAMKEEMDSRTLRDALQVVSSMSADLSSLPGLHRLEVELLVVPSGTLQELQESLSDSIFLSRPLSQTHSLVLVALLKSEGGRLEKTMKTLELKPLTIPSNLPQNPAEAYHKLTKDYEDAKKERAESEARLEEIRRRSDNTLLAVRELTEVARDTLDEARVSGGMKRLASVSGYIPTKRNEEFKQKFGKWVTFSEPIGAVEHGEKVPTLLENSRALGPFQLITDQQGTPGVGEVDPTPMISFVFPIFFGMMFGDFGHGIIFTIVAFLVRQRGTGSLRQWGNIFLAAGISATVFGAVFGEFFGFKLYSFIPVPPIIEIMQTPFQAIPTPDIANIQIIMIVSILIGVAHLTTGLTLDLYEAIKANERAEALIGKLPTLTMYLSGVGYGIAFIGAGYSFNVLKTSAPAPLLGIPNNLLGGLALGVLLPSMVVIFIGKGVAIKLGKMHGESAATAISNGGLEVFERISQFLSNTISYVRLAIMVLVHAVLVQTVNFLTPITNPVMIPLWIIFNALILTFEALIVYIQDLRLHIYEFFTKFYRGTGTPFRKILPDRVRIKINWK